MEATAVHQQPRQSRQDRRSATPLTDASTFTITELDVGSAAVRAGIAATLEQERMVLLTAAKLALTRMNGRFEDAVAHTALESAIRVAEAGK